MPTNNEDSNWHIALRKGIHSTCNPHLVYKFISYQWLSPSYFSFIYSVSSITISINEWQQTMIVEIQPLEHNHTWDLVPLPLEQKIISCRFVYTIKVGPNGEVDLLKSVLVAK